MTTCPPSTTDEPPIPLWAKATIGVLGVIVLVLTIIIMTVICILFHLNRYLIMVYWYVQDNTDNVYLHTGKKALDQY